MNPAPRLRKKCESLLLKHARILAHTAQSSFREKTLEHIFVGECLRCLWRIGVHNAEVLQADVDGAGYDIVFDVGGVLRHIQLKSSVQDSSTSVQKINRKLAEKPSGCVVWIRFGDESLNLGPFLWFGGAPNRPLPDLGKFKTAKHTKANTKGEKLNRPNIVVIPAAKFERLDTIEAVVDKLFGLGGRRRSA